MSDDEDDDYMVDCPKCGHRFDPIPEEMVSEHIAQEGIRDARSEFERATVGVADADRQRLVDRAEWLARNAATYSGQESILIEFVRMIAVAAKELLGEEGREHLVNVLSAINQPREDA